MRDGKRKLKYWFKNGVYLALSMLFVFVGLGCASTRKTTKTETVVTQSNDAAANQAGQESVTTGSTSSDQQSRATTTTTATETKPGGHPGILSSTVHAIGWVIALPFRLVGGLIGWIF